MMRELRIRVIGRTIFQLWLKLPFMRPALNRVMSGFFGGRAQAWDQSTDTADEGRLAPLFEAIELVGISPDRIVDVGCGTGVAAIALSDRFPDAWVLGVDVSAAMVEQARVNANQRGSAARFSVAAGDHLAEPDESVDLAAFVNAPPSAAEIGRVLSPGGAAIVTFSAGDKTPFYASASQLRRQFEHAGLREFAHGSVGNGEYAIAVKAPLRSRPKRGLTASADSSTTVDRGRRVYTVIMGNIADERKTRKLSAELRSLGLAFEIAEAGSVKELAAIAAEVVRTGRIPVVFGGDGTVHHVLRGACAAATDTRPTIAIVPAGTGNDGARSLGIPFDLARACETVAFGEPLAVDLGLIRTALPADGDTCQAARISNEAGQETGSSGESGQSNSTSSESGQVEIPYLTVACIGLDSECTNVIAQGPPGRRLRYPITLLNQLRGWQPLQYRIAVDGEQLTMAGWTTCVANGRFYGAGAEISPNSLTDDGLLDLVTVGEMSRLSVASRMPSLYRGAHLKFEEVNWRTCHEVTVDTDRPLVVAADGERVATTPVTLSIKPRAINVIMAPVRSHV